MKDSYEIIDIQDGETIDINIITERNETTTLSIFWDTKNDDPHLHNCRNLGRRVSQEKANTLRSTTFDKGNMYIMGNGMKRDGSVGTYNLTKYDGVEDALKNIVTTAESYYRSLGLHTVVDDIIEKKETFKSFFYHYRKNYT